jgi:hypothetical protein
MSHIEIVVEILVNAELLLDIYLAKKNFKKDKFMFHAYLIFAVCMICFDIGILIMNLF